MSRFLLDIQGPLDICEAQRRVRRLAGAAGLREDGTFRLLIAVTEIANHLFIVSRRGGSLVLRLLRRGERLGLEITARVHGQGPWATDLPPVEGLVDELDAGFDVAGRVYVRARAWAGTAAPSSVVACAAAGRWASAGVA